MTIMEFIKKHELYLCYLHDRWRDECEYEDFDAYRKAIKKLMPPDWVLTRATPHPFEFYMTTPKKQARVRVTNTKIRHWTSK